VNIEQQQIAPETVVLLRRLLVQHRAHPRVYRDLLLLDVLLHDYRGRVELTELGDAQPGTPSWYLTAAEVAGLLGVTVDAVQKACRLGRLHATKQPGSREWRIPPAAVAAYRAA
jgi:excisionase family DNA binding protein